MTEHDLQNNIRLELSKHGYIERANVGKVKLADGRIFDTGLPRGRSDLLFIKDGRACFIEVKVKPNRPSPEQENFIYQMIHRYGAKAGVAYSVEDALRIYGSDWMMDDDFAKGGKYYEVYKNIINCHKKHKNAKTDDDWIKLNEDLRQFTTELGVELSVVMVNEIKRSNKVGS